MRRDLTERVLQRLGVSGPPSVDLEGLGQVYRAWCRQVPFDNVRKLIHVRSGDSGPLPGDDPVSFFEAWLTHGCGGTCWSANGALCALLESLGFEAERALAIMLVAPDLPPNHGSVVVTVASGGQPTDREGAVRYVVDASILHHDPLPIPDKGRSSVENLAWGVVGRWLHGQFQVRWRNFMIGGEPMECAFVEFGVGGEEFSRRHEMTRRWSPFNFGLSLHLVRDRSRVGAAGGKLWRLDETGRAMARNADLAERRRFLIEEVGMSEELVSRLPDDVPMEPPP